MKTSGRLRRWARGARIEVPHARRRVVAMVALGLVRGLLETALVVQVVALAVAVTDGRADGLPVTGGLAVGPLALTCLVVATTAVAIAVHAASERLVTNVFAQVTITVRRRLLLAWCRAGWPEQAREPAGRLQDLFTTAVTAVASGAVTVSAALVAAVHLVVVTVAAVMISPLASVAVLGFGTCAALAAHPFRVRARRLVLASVGANQSLATIVAEAAALGRDLRTFGVDEVVVERARGPVEDAARLVARATLRSRQVPALTRDITIAAVAVAIGLIGLTSATHIGQLGATIVLLMRGIGYIQQTSMAAQAITDRRAHLDRLDEAFDRYTRSAPVPGALRPAGLGQIHLDGVTFAYPGGHGPALRDVTLSLAPGELIGVTGASGAGKSTLLHVLLGLLRPTIGRITADGIDIADIDPTLWRRWVAFVPQDPHLVTGSVADNIRFLRADMTDADVERAALAAALGPDLAAWPAGLGHPVGQLGAALSGGQRQRIALARALAGRPRLLVLDEPTSALDSVSETAVRSTIDRVRGTTTVLVVAHRASTLDVCDRLVRMHDGRLVDDAARSVAPGAGADPPGTQRRRQLHHHP